MAGYSGFVTVLLSLVRIRKRTCYWVSVEWHHSMRSEIESTRVLAGLRMQHQRDVGQDTCIGVSARQTRSLSSLACNPTRLRQALWVPFIQTKFLDLHGTQGRTAWPVCVHPLTCSALTGFFPLCSSPAPAFLILAAYLRMSLNLGLALHSLATQHPSHAVLHATRILTLTMEQTNPSLIQPGDPSHPNRAPLFLIHDAGGAVFNYYKLAPLGRPVYSIHNPWFRNKTKWDGGALMFVHKYIELIKSVVPRGDVLVGGMMGLLTYLPLTCGSTLDAIWDRTLMLTDCDSQVIPSVDSLGLTLAACLHRTDGPA